MAGVMNLEKAESAFLNHLFSSSISSRGISFTVAFVPRDSRALVLCRSIRTMMRMKTSPVHMHHRMSVGLANHSEPPRVPLIVLAQQQMQRQLQQQQEQEQEDFDHASHSVDTSSYKEISLYNH
jgi:hypothetical protein